MAGDFLQQLATRNLPPTDLAVIAQAAGDESLLRLRTSPLVTPERRAIAQRLQEASFQVSRDAARLQQRVTELFSPDAVARRTAQSELLRGGDVSVSLLVAALMGAPPENVSAADFERIITQQLRLHPRDATGAVERASVELGALNDPAQSEIQLRLVRTLVQLRWSLAARQALSLIYSQSLNDDARQSLAQLVQSRLQSLPSQESSVDLLAADLQRTLAAWSIAPYGGEAAEPVWLSGPGANAGSLKVAQALVTPREAFAAAADLQSKRLLIASGVDSLSTRGDGLLDVTLASQLGAAYMADPNFGLAPEHFQQFVTKTGQQPQERLSV